MCVLYMVAILVAAFGINSIETLMFVSFLGGSLGWLSGIVHFAHLTMRYDNTYGSIVGAGDAASGVLVAMLAFAQQPELGEEDRLFGASTYYLLCLPLVGSSLVAFWYIERTKLGALPVTAAILEGPTAVLLEKHADASSSSLLLGALLPSFASAAEMRRQVGTALILMFVVFSQSITCWGFGDSLVPYACGNAEQGDNGKSCVLHASFGTVFATLLGSNAAAWVTPKMSGFILPFLVYAVAFAAFALAAAGVGAGRVRALGEGYVVGLLLAMRTLAPYMRSLAQRLIQTHYEPSQFEGMNAVLLWTSVSANVGGTLIVTCILG